jgi:FolB domain-containing protein
MRENRAQGPEFYKVTVTFEVTVTLKGNLMDKIIIKNLLLRGIIGINDDERINKQDILINITIFADTRKAAVTDNIEDAVNYRTITKRIIDHVEASSDFLVEKLVNDIARIILMEFSAERVIVRLEKPGALRFAQSVGIEIDRTRADVIG